MVDKLIDYAAARAAGRKIKDVRAGLGYTCVMLEDGACGLAYTFRNEMGHGCSILGDAGRLIGRDAGEILSWAKHRHLLKASIGLAAANAVINNHAGIEWRTGNVVEALELGPSDTFGMVGDFGPILMHIRGKTEKIYVFEKNPPEGSGLYREEDIPAYLPRCDVAVVTSTSIINHTIDGVLAHCRNARSVCLVGPSTPLCPEVLREHNVTLLAGSLVLETDRALEIVSQGGGTMSLKPVCRQVLVKV